MMSKADRTKQFIIERTAPIFNAKGFVGTSINDIINATGLTKGSIYGNFENKDEVGLAAFDHNFGMICSYIRKKMEHRPKMIDKLLVYVETYRIFLDLPFLSAGCPVLNTSTEADDTHPLLRIKAVNALNFWRDSIKNIIKVGIDSKEIKSQTNAGDFSFILMSLVEGAVMQAKVTGNPKVLESTMNFLEKLIMDLKV